MNPILSMKLKMLVNDNPEGINQYTEEGYRLEREAHKSRVAARMATTDSERQAHLAKMYGLMEEARVSHAKAREQGYVPNAKKRGGRRGL
jgi:hypothetical protein